MIASVQYNDLRGTAAADVSDFYKSSLQKYLMNTYKTYDSERYKEQKTQSLQQNVKLFNGINLVK